MCVHRAGLSGSLHDAVLSLSTLWELVGHGNHSPVYNRNTVGVSNSFYITADQLLNPFTDTELVKLLVLTRCALQNLCKNYWVANDNELDEPAAAAADPVLALAHGAEQEGREYKRV